ncbi:hypothetical protein Q4I32_001142 [Leishmania shawi]|uniref:Protein kinase domain-containing protein n=1 Tax=Leishmania shawi TaxID=5680 RepID=A0AAW3CAJ7_9TRYP
MELSRRIARLPCYRGAPAAREDGLTSSPGVYVLCEDLAFSPGGEHPSCDEAAVVSKLNKLTSKYAQFQRNVVGCVFAMTSGASATALGSAPAVRHASSRFPSEGLDPSSAADKGRMTTAGRVAASATSGSAGSTPSVPDLESYWMETSPLPPTAVLAALYGMTPLHGISWSSSNRGGPDAGAEENLHIVTTVDADRLGSARSSTSSLELQWSLCGCAADAIAVQGRYQVTFRDAFAMTTVAAHMAAAGADGGSSWQGAVSLVPPLSSSTSSYSLAQQLRRVSALLGLDSEGSPPEALAAVPPSASLLDWPEEFLWNLLVSLLSSLALVHSAGLHLFGQMTAADVLCVACTPTLPRQLEQTWADVAAATAAAAGKEDVRRSACGTVSSGRMNDDCVPTHKEADAIFRRFCSIAVPSVLLPQATVTAATPCHHVFFVLHPSPELFLQKGNDRAHVLRQSVPSLSAAQESKQTTPAQQAQHQAADLASVGRLMSLLMELRARWRQRWHGHADTAAVPSSELAFLVRKLSECGGPSASSATSTQSPTALQLLQLQALRLRTESWYYRRLAEEACDRLSLARRWLESADAGLLRPSLATLSHARNSDTEGQMREAQLADREAQLTDREAKLNVVLELYGLTHEHLDALKLSQLPSAQERTSLAALSPTLQSDAAAVGAPAKLTSSNRGTHTAGCVGADQRTALKVRNEDSLDRLLTQTLLQQQHHLAGAAATLLAGVTAEDGETPASTRDGRYLSPQATTATASVVPATTAGATDGEVLLGLSSVARRTTADDTLLLTRAAAPSMAAETSPAPPTQRHLDVEGIPEGDVATPPTAAAAGHHFNDESRVTVVEVDLDAAEDDGRGINVASQASASPTAIHAASAGGLEGRAAWAATVTSPSALLYSSTAAVTRQGAQGWPQPTSQQQRQQRQLFSPPLHTSPFLDMQTPMRSPALPNMGYPDGSAGGTAASPGAGVSSGGGCSHSKYSALSLLRTPPSARRRGTRVGTAAAVAAVGTRAAPSFFRSPSLHSPDSYRSSTRPHSAPTTDVLASAAAVLSPHVTTERSLPQQRQHRRRSSSRGSAGDNSGGAYAGALGGLSPPTEGYRQQRNGDAAAWAHQQLTALEEMQTMLRAQQPPTPRSRASAAAATCSRSPDVAALACARSPATPLLAPRVAAGRHSSPTAASSEVTPVRGTMPSYCGDPAGMCQMENAHMRSSDSRSGARHSDDWGGSTSAARDFGGVAIAERPRVLLSFTPPYNMSLTSSPSIYQTPAETMTSAEGGARIAYAAAKSSETQSGAAGQRTPPAVQHPTTTRLYGGASHEPTSSLSPPTRTKIGCDDAVTVARRGNNNRSSVSSVFHSSALSASGAVARGNNAADLHQRSPPQHATSSPAMVSTVRSSAFAFGASAGISSHGTGGRNAHRPLSSRTASAHTTGPSAGGTNARGTVMSTSSSRVSGSHGGGGGPLQRPGDSYSPSASWASFAYADASRTSSTTAVELLRRLRANTGA